MTPRDAYFSWWSAGELADKSDEIVAQSADWLFNHTGIGGGDAQFRIMLIEEMKKRPVLIPLLVSLRLNGKL